jgi:hypothetical protein
MVDLKILERYGCTHDRLREIFTETDESTDNFRIRAKFEDYIESRVRQGIFHSAKNSNLFMSVDLAWDSLPINKATIPLLQYAQGKISIEDTAECLEDVGLSEQFCEYNEEGNLKSINLLRLYEVSVNIIRSYVTRRVAAQVSRFSNLFPYFKYEPRGTSAEDKLRADALSQRVEMMCDQFNYRHLFGQGIRDMFMYGFVLMFPSSAWTRATTWRENKTKPEGIESYVCREGVDFVKPHPTRIMHDQSKPLADINTDNGPDWVGYWDVLKYGDICDNPGYWNTDDISFNTNLFGAYDSYKEFFSYYLDPESMKFPTRKSEWAMKNDRTANTGVYGSEDEDKGIFLSHYFCKVNPAEEGIGDYPNDVWMKMVVASDNTVLHAEFLPSIPAIYGGLNQNDARMVNISVAHELMPFQDQMNNIMNKMLHDMKISMMKIFAIDQDALDDEVKAYIQDAMSEGTMYTKPHALFYSGAKIADLGLNAKDFISVIEVQNEMQASVNQAIQSTTQLLNLVERLLILSPQELGQPAPREISATEVTEIATTTQAIYSFISEGIDELRAGAKKMLFEHLVACSTEEFRVPVQGRYTKEIVKNAGFQEAPYGASSDYLNPQAKRTVIGTPDILLHEYNFSSRDGAERAVNTQSAQTLAGLLQQIVSVQPIMQAVGTEKILEIMNEIFRLSGAAYDLNVETDTQEDMSLANAQFVEQLKQTVPQITQIIQGMNQEVQTIKGALAQQPQAQPQVQRPPQGQFQPGMPPQEVAGVQPPTR